MKGVIYIMTTAVSGLIKIGKTGTQNYEERMRHLERNGYYDVAGLKRFFAIELEDYDDKESLLHEIFSKHQVEDSELFALDCELAQQLLLAFDGKVVYPKNIDKGREFDEVTESRKQGALFSFYQKGLANGDVITFVQDNTITATVVGEREVEYNEEVYKLSPLTRDIFQKKGQANASGAYQGAAYWMFKGEKLKDLRDTEGEKMKNPEFGTQPDFTIREMRLEDGEITYNLLRELHVATYTNDELGVTAEKIKARLNRYTPEQRRQRLEKRLADDNEQSYVAVDGSGEIVGMVAPKIEDSGVHRLGALYVREDHHGKGVAGELMKKALAWLGAEHNRVELHVATYSDRAKAFYRKWGFEEVPGSEALFDDLIPEVTMVRQPRRWDDETQR